MARTKITLQTPWPADLRARVSDAHTTACGLLDFLIELKASLQADPRAAVPHPEFGTTLGEWVEIARTTADELRSDLCFLDSEYFNPWPTRLANKKAAR